MATLTLRTTKGSPLTNQEVDDNFTNLNTEIGTKLASSSYTAADVLAKLLTVDGTGSGIDADTIDGLNTATANTANTVVVRDSSGNFSAGTVTANLTGTASKATNIVGGLAGSVPYNTAADTTSLLAIGTSGTYMKSTGSAPAWATASTVKTDLSLNNVENTALSTWAGTSNITTVGTIGTGTWNATTISVSKGGTGATSFTNGVLVKGAGTSSLSSATVGVDYLDSSTAATISGKHTHSGLLSVAPMIEKVFVSATAATGTINFDILTQAVLYYTTNASGNWVLNVRGNSSTTLNSIMATGESMTLAFMATNGSTAYYQTDFQIDGSSTTIKWQNASAASSGNANSIDLYYLTIIKTANATFTVIGSQNRFA